MASARRDDLARRLAERLEKSPAKGSAMKATGDDAAPDLPSAKRTSPAAPRKRGRKPAGSQRSAGTLTERSSDRPVPRSTGKRRVPSERSSVGPQRPKRRAAGTVLRGHLVPEAIHRDARRRKVELRSSRGERVTWDDVMTEAVATLVENPARATAILDDLGRSNARGARGRLVQATLPEDLDRRLVELHLDLSERPDRSVTYEQLWTTCMLMWLDSTV
jgi:hypothetical protein